MQRLLAEAQARGAVEEYALRRDHGGDLLAASLVPLQAVAALAARRHPAQHDVVADGERGDAFAEFGDDARALVAHDERGGGVPLTPLHVEVGMADAGGGDLDAHLARLRGGERDVGDLYGRAGFTEHYSFHVVLPDVLGWGGVRRDCGGKRAAWLATARARPTGGEAWSAQRIVCTNAVPCHSTVC